MPFDIGSIVVLKKIIFKKTHMRDKRTIDHAYKTGRPAIVICEANDKIYHILLTHSCYEDEYKDGRYYPIVDSKTNEGENGFIDFSEIHSRPICYERECEYIADEDLHDILVAFCTYQESVFEDDEYEEIRPYLYSLIKDLEKNKELCLKK